MEESQITSIVAQYPVLCVLVQQLSTLDLFHLSLTSKAIHSYIQPSSNLFKVLTRQSLCDGLGLVKRQEFKDLYHTDYTDYDSEKDEPIEVQLWSLKCGESDALPCVKCGINVCEECRYLDREALMSGKLNRVPYPDTNAEHDNFMALCPPCDAKMEQEVQQKGYASPVCDCDAYTRWICLKCRKDEVKYTIQYSEEGVKTDWNEGEDEETKYFYYHQTHLWVSSFILAALCSLGTITLTSLSALVFLRECHSRRNKHKVHLVQASAYARK